MTTIFEQVAALATDPKKKPAVLTTVALPGSGKTTLVKSIEAYLLARGIPFKTIPSSDQIRDQLAGVGERQAKYDPTVNSEVFRILHEHLQTALAAGKLAIIDSTNLSRNPNNTFREEAVQAYRGLGARTVAALVLEVPVEVAKARNEARDAKGQGFVEPGDIDLMEAYRQRHPLTPETPGEFDLVIVHPYQPDAAG